MSEKCTVCKDPLPADDFVRCSVNKCGLHYECSGVSEKTYRMMGPSRKNAYKCRICREDSGSGTDSSLKKSEKLSAKPLTLEDIFNKIESSENRIKEKIKEVKDQVNDLEAAVQYCSDKVDDFSKELDEMNKKLNDVTEENLNLVKKNTELSKKVENLEKDMQEIQQYSRRFNIQLDGIPEVQNEKTMNIITKLATVIDEPIIINQDVQAAHRLPTNNTRRVPSFLIQFTNKQKRDAVFKKARGKKLVSTDFVRCTGNSRKSS